VRVASTGSLLVLAAIAVCTSANTDIAEGARSDARAGGLSNVARASRIASGTPPSTAPAGPPLLGPGAGAGVSGGDEEASPRPSPGELDPLVSNGLASPLCRDPFGEGEVSLASRRRCDTSGFSAAPAPTGDYGIDVHIDTGLLGLSSGGLLSAVQNLFVTPLWMALVWAVHALVVMLEWAFTLDLLDTATAGGLGAGLRQMQAAITLPWLATVLALASVLALYNGLMRRRVAETMGHTLLMVSMMAGGMWVIADPAGTVGAVGAWANQASLGTLAVTARGTPARPGRALGESMRTVFAAAIEDPWCYLEFGDVGWCRDPVRLDPSLRAAGLKIAAAQLSMIGCRAYAAVLPCASAGSARARALEHSAQLLAEARTNGAVFLALPTNGASRNSINQQGSLLRTICQSPDATSCRGPAAAQAEFRTNAGTWPRVGGLLLIGAGVLGMLLLLGFIGLRLLTAALFGLLFLLLAPGMVLAPAFGETGRAIFRKWAAQLFGAVVSKLLFAFLLGVVLAVGGILSELRALGWWTQWLLMSAFWWGAFARRHQALALAHGSVGQERTRTPSLARRVGDAFDPPRKAVRFVRETREKRAKPAPDRRHLAEARSLPRRSASAEATRRTRPRLPREEASNGSEKARGGAAPSEQSASTRDAQLARVRHEQGKAIRVGDTRRALELGHRATRIEGDADHDRDLAAGAGADGRTAAAGPGAGPDLREAQRGQAPARDPAPVAPPRRAPGNSAKPGRPTHEPPDLPPAESTRVEIDRELADTRERNDAVRDLAREDPVAQLRGDVRPQPDRQADSAPEPGGRQGPRLGGPSGEESSVMRDAREVAAGRKRQLGFDRD
jgi:hypothetical protein